MSHVYRTMRRFPVWVLAWAMVTAAMTAPAQVPQPRDARRGLAFTLDLLQTEAFRKRFAESYLAETEIEPRVTAKEREELLEIIDLIASNDPEEVEQAAERLADMVSESASAVIDFTLANVRFQQERFDEALVAYKRAVEKHPKFLRAHKHAGFIHMQRGDYSDAIASLTRVLELGGADAVTYGSLGYAYTMTDDNVAAESAYRMAILLDAKTEQWQLGLAQSFFKQERFAEAAAFAGQLLEKQPSSAKLWELQAKAYLGQDKPLRAAENLEMVKQLGGASAQNLMLLGDIYVNAQLFDLAVDAYASAMEGESAAAPDRFVRSAQALAAHGAHDAAERMIAQIESVYGDTLAEAQRKDMLKLRARLAVAAGEGDEEVRVLEEIVVLDPLDGEALMLLGDHSRRAGDAEKAIFYYERAAAIEAFEADANVRHAQLLVSEGRYEEALQRLRRAQQVEYRDNVQEYLEQVETFARSR